MHAPLSRLIALLGVTVVLAGCAISPYSSPEAMAEHQRDRVAQLATLSPPGTPRAQLLAEGRSRLRFEETFLLPLATPVVSQSWAPIRGSVEHELPHMLAAARLLTATEPTRVDVFSAAVGTMYLSYDGHYVFYDEHDHVLIVLDSAWIR